MRRTVPTRLLGQLPRARPAEVTLPFRLASSQCLRPFSSTSKRPATDDDPLKPFPAPPSQTRPAAPFAPRTSPSLHAKASRSDPMKDLVATFGEYVQHSSYQRQTGRRNTLIDTEFNSSQPEDYSLREKETVPPHQIHVYASRHNCHITVVRPPGYKNPKTGEISKNRTPAISLSAGNLGFNHSARKHYDTAYQLISFVMNKMQDTGLNAEINEIELFLRGFGAGREAVTKAILGLEGRHLRNKIVKVSDATRLKFGGTRGKKPRRLG